jgi:hypothetical protein
VDGLLIGIVACVLFGVTIGLVAGLTALACQHPKSYEKVFAALLIILLGRLLEALSGDLRTGAGYSRFVVIVVIIYFSFLRALPLFLGKEKPVRKEDDK